MVKRLPAMQKTWIQSLGQKDLLEKEMATHSNILAWKIQWATVHGVTKSRARLVLLRTGMSWVLSADLV